ncbi:SpoIIE family protein phosphatase [Streptomyces crystallinus]|uniref:PPM-type phosphatase domain-containing protein n=1 Tax=Streptomyces crystallinus TaxID=68191 RepID=A0ABN1FH88_9ACTN
MGSIPTQRETGNRPLHPAPSPDATERGAACAARTSLPGNPLAPSAARRFVRAALADWTGQGAPGAERLDDRAADDAAILVNELVTNAVVHAGTTVELVCCLEPPAGDEPGAVVVEVSDHHPSRVVRNEPRGVREPGAPEHGRGLHLVAALAECWGITYRTGLKTVWARLLLDADEAARREADPGSDERLQRGLRAAGLLAAPPRGAPGQDRDWVNRGALSFLAEASDLLAGQFDEDMIAALAGQLLVPRLCDWCAIWLDPEAGGPVGEPRLARVWHARESGIEELRAVLEKEPPRLPESARGGPVPMPWPGPREDEDGAALAYRMVAGGRAVGVLMLGRAGTARIPDEVTGLVEDFVRRVALAIGAARQYTRQVTISRVLQRGLLPAGVAEIPGVDSALVYQPSGEGVAGGDFYDLFPGADGRWCFALGDVQGSGPEAAVVTGLVRPWLRLLAREGYAVHDVLDRLNKLLVDDGVEAAEAAARMVAAAGGREVAEGPQARFLSLLYGELVPVPAERGGGVVCTLASAGHPLPLLLRPEGSVRAAAVPQVLIGVVEGAAYESESFRLMPGDTLLCVTDGVTERRSGRRMFDDGDGLAEVLAGCVGMTATGVAESVKRAVYAFGTTPPEDDLALLVLQAR